MKLTIVYLTFRIHPRFEWFAASLARELRDTATDPAEVQIVVIDGRLWHEGHHRRLGLLDAAAGRIKFEHYPPKPTIWQGPHKLTKSEFFCAANARNTAFCYARAPHVAFVDDLSVLLPGWLAAHFAAAAGEYVLAGTTCKNRNIVVDGDGSIRSFDKFPPGQDSRLPRITSDRIERCGGSWLYGGTFSVPLARALQVNGQDEIHDTIGGEDYDFGIRLERVGANLFIHKACGTIEDEDGHHTEAAMVRLDKPWADRWMGPYSSNYLLNKLQKEDRRSGPIGNPWNLAEIRDKVLAGGEFPIPTGPDKHWVDGQPLAEL